MKKTIIILLTASLISPAAMADGETQRGYDNLFNMVTAAAAVGALILAGEAYKNSLEEKKQRENALDFQREMNKPIKKVESVELPVKPNPLKVQSPGTANIDPSEIPSAIEVGGYGKKPVFKSSDGEKVDPKNNRVHNYDENNFGAPLLRRIKQPNDSLTIKLKGAK